jgi:hypothetical protein
MAQHCELSRNTGRVCVCLRGEEGWQPLPSHVGNLLY